MAGVETIKFKTRVDQNTGKRVRYEVPRAEWRYQARWLDPDGKSRAKNFKLKGDAERHLERIGVSIQDGDYVDPKRRRELFRDWAAVWWKTTNQLADHTRRGYWQRMNTNVLPAFGGWRVVGIDFMDVEEFIADCFEVPYDGVNTYSWKTVREMISVMAQIMDGPMRSGLRRDNPARGHKVKSRKKPITEGDVLDLRELLSLIDHVRDPYKPAVWLLVLTGMRPEELAGLRVRNIDFAGNVVSIEKTVSPVPGYDGKKYRLVEGPPKTAAGYRKIGIPPEVTEMLSEMLTARFAGRPVDQDAFLFTQPKGGPLDNKNFRERVIIPALRAAGLPISIRTYDLRHSHASILIALGCTPPEVAMQMGHSNPSVSLSIYTHLFKGAQEALAGKLHDKVRELQAEPPTVVRLNALPAAAERLSVEERRRQVADLHAKGLSRRSIAAELGVSWQTVQRDVQAISECIRNASECKKTGEKRGSKGQPGKTKKTG